MLYIGIDYELCGKLNPRRVKPFEEAFKKRMKHEDYSNWMLGGYIHEAVSFAIVSAFSKKRIKYRDKPYMEEAEENAVKSGEVKLSEEEQMILVQKAFEKIALSVQAELPKDAG